MFEGYNAACDISKMIAKAYEQVEREREILLNMQEEDSEMYVMDLRYNSHKANYYYWRAKVESYCEIIKVLVSHNVAESGLFIPLNIERDPITMQVKFESLGIDDY